MTQNDVYSKIRLPKRNPSNLPLAAFTAKNWCDYSALIFQEVYGEKFPDYPAQYASHSQLITNYVYPILFRELKWSCLDFANFLKEVTIQSKKNGIKRFTLALLKSEMNKKFAQKYNQKLITERNKDYFSRSIYTPHIFLTENKDDLIYIVKQIEKDHIKIFYNYGIPIFCKYFQIKNNTSLEESIKYTKSSLKSIISYHKKDLMMTKKILDGIAESSVRWGPYCNKALLKKGIKESEVYFDWQEELKDLWKFFKCDTSDYWESHFSTKKRRMIRAVKDLFLIDIEKLRNKI